MGYYAHDVYKIKNLATAGFFVFWIPAANKTKSGERCGAYMFQSAAKLTIDRTTI